MKDSQHGENIPLIEAIQELVIASRNLAKSEINLIRAEVRTTIKDTARDTLLIAVSCLTAFLGLLPFMAFLIIGLGNLLGNNYWLSSLIVSVVFTLAGSIFGRVLFKKLLQKDITLPRTRQSLQNESQMVQSQIKDIKETSFWSKAA